MHTAYHNIYRLHTTHSPPQLGDSSSSSSRAVVIDQSDMFTHVFSVFEDHKDIKYKFMVAVLIEYIRSLNQYGIPVQVRGFLLPFPILFTNLVDI